jgi:hypothetical protein
MKKDKNAVFQRAKSKINNYNLKDKNNFTSGEVFLKKIKA